MPVSVVQSAGTGAVIGSGRRRREDLEYQLGAVAHCFGDVDLVTTIEIAMVPDRWSHTSRTSVMEAVGGAIGAGTGAVIGSGQDRQNRENPQRRHTKYQKTIETID